MENFTSDEFVFRLIKQLCVECLRRHKHNLSQRACPVIFPPPTKICSWRSLKVAVPVLLQMGEKFLPSHCRCFHFGAHSPSGEMATLFFLKYCPGKLHKNIPNLEGAPKKGNCSTSYGCLEKSFFKRSPVAIASFACYLETFFFVLPLLCKHAGVS